MNPLPSDVHADMPVLFIFLRYKFTEFEHFRICVAIPPTTASRSLWCLQTCSRKRCATPAESTVVTVGMAWVHLDSLSTTTRMALYPLDSSSSPMVSMEITSQQQLGIWFGVSFPTFCVGKDLQCLQASPCYIAGDVVGDAWPPGIVRTQF